MKIAKHMVEIKEIRELKKEKQELLEIISVKDKEMENIKTKCAEEFVKIKDLCFGNNYGDRYMKLRKIHEIAEDNFSALVRSLIIDQEITKLSTTDQSNR